MGHGPTSLPLAMILNKMKIPICQTCSVAVFPKKSIDVNEDINQTAQPLPVGTSRFPVSGLSRDIYVCMFAFVP